MAPYARTVLRLKRSAGDASLDELAVSVPVLKRSRVVAGPDAGSASAPPARTLRFRRIVSAQPQGSASQSATTASAQAAPRVIDLDLAAVLRTPTTDTPASGPFASTALSDPAAAAVVYDLYEAAPAGSTAPGQSPPRVAWIDSSLLPAEFFGSLISSDDDDDDYSEGDERSVDYPSTPESSGGDAGSQISDGELGSLATAPVYEGLRDRWSALRSPGYQTRSRFRDRRFDGASDSDDGI